MITGDDILIEYVSRLLKVLSSNRVRESELNPEKTKQMDKFITHYVWYA